LSGGDGFERREDGSVLLLEIEAGDPAESRVRFDRVRAALLRADVPSEVTLYDDADALWTVRGRAGVALDERLGPRVREDVAVPLGEIDRLVRELERIGVREHAPLYLFGHLGEGSLHPNYAVDPGSAGGARVREAVLSTSLALSGTISGEHGIGALKSSFLEREVGAEGIRILRAVKAACDPDGILNPGKLYPPTLGPTDGRPSPYPSEAAAGGTRTA
jgi:glycolate oxidase